VEARRKVAGAALAAYRQLGGVWDLGWLIVRCCSRVALRREYWRNVIVPADPRAWSWLHRTFRLPEEALVLLYRGLFFYGLGRMITWFLYARFDAKTPFQPVWRGPLYLPGNDISDAGVGEVLVRTSIGGVLFVAFLWLCWRRSGALGGRRGCRSSKRPGLDASSMPGDGVDLIAPGSATASPLRSSSRCPRRVRHEPSPGRAGRRYSP
jgi:hypothetical protein